MEKIRTNCTNSKHKRLPNSTYKLEQEKNILYLTLSEHKNGGIKSRRICET